MFEMAPKTVSENVVLTWVAPDTKDLDTAGGVILSKAQSMTVTNEQENTEAGGFLRAIKSLATEIGQRFKPSKEAAHRTHAEICKLEASHLDPLKKAENIIKKLIGGFLVAEEAKRQKQQERLNVKAEKKGEIAVVVPEVAKPEGISLRESWRAEVTDFKALVKAVAAGKAPFGLLMPNQKELDALAKALKTELTTPGVRAVKEVGVAARVGATE